MKKSKKYDGMIVWIGAFTIPSVLHVLLPQ